MTYIGKFVLLRNPDSRYSSKFCAICTYLLKVDAEEYKCINGDIFRHNYLTGKAVLVDISKKELELLSTRVTIKTVRANSVFLVDVNKDLTSLFD